MDHGGHPRCFLFGQPSGFALLAQQQLRLIGLHFGPLLTLLRGSTDQPLLLPSTELVYVLHALVEQRRPLLHNGGRPSEGATNAVVTAVPTLTAEGTRTTAPTSSSSYTMWAIIGICSAKSSFAS
ncbi:hypothetical protein Taro_025376 [Colocasia esculenta]|uniref:Uncharacterized protein n=1 Tax=Colocasia esculenta TaxID=4460 RepID=A0A843V8R2_COLES|nr:hypothetical protein [Colocasia esculenta]